MDRERRAARPAAGRQLPAGAGGPKDPGVGAAQGDPKRRNLDPIALAEAVTEAGTAWGSTGSAQTLQNLRDEVQGLSVLEQFATLPGVSDVLVDGRGQVWTDSAQGLRLTGFSFSSAEQVRRLAVHFASLAGKRLDEAMPFVDVSVRGYRIHAVLPPVAVQGPVISIRVKQAAGRGLDQLLGAAHRWWQPLLQAVVSTEQNFLVSGGTGSGKTTLLQAMLGLVDSGQRLVIVEDTHELQVEHEHVVSLQARLPNAEHRGEVRLSDW
ncbi:ATPase, T2SS/T4P/T4SS family [Arthrobacter sp. JCM 19049]|uniref:ATPase, T2SS/T4P/T4SS family n=1 Tax=Arthrobacter sp. JCM 19049 TaxID=1460643 RepID=UPI0006D2942D|nr:ATPase, T2SS/T4P/T4SS family [Arthrobacter sp. JCM 19049]